MTVFAILAIGSFRTSQSQAVQAQREPVAAEQPKSEARKLLDEADATEARQKAVEEAEFILRAQGRLCYEALDVKPTGIENVSDVKCKVVADGKTRIVDYRLDVPGNRITVLNSVPG